MSDVSKALSCGLDEDAVEVWDLIQPEKRALSKLKDEAVRRGLWGRVLSWNDRRYIDALTMAHIGRTIRSPLVLRILAPIVKKLLKALGKILKTPLRIVGRAADEEAIRGTLSLMGETAHRMMRGVAEELSRIARGWGNRLARKWSEDAGFIKYLLMMNLPQNRNPRSIFTIRL